MGHGMVIQDRVIARCEMNEEGQARICQVFLYRISSAGREEVIRGLCQVGVFAEEDRTTQSILILSSFRACTDTLFISALVYIKG